jgi:hypothetical protein
MRTTFSVVIGALLAAGCAAPVLQEPDTTPTNPTAIIETRVTNHGIKGFFPYEGTHISYTRANMRREDDDLKGTGTFSRYILRPDASSNITRLDRNLLWTLNRDKKEYTECPVAGCRSAAPTRPAAKDEPQEPKAERDPGCIMAISKASFTVTPTRQKRMVNGFDAEQYRVKWLVELQDNTRRKTTSTLNVELWTTPVSGPLREALAVEENYHRALFKAVRRADQPVGVLPNEVRTMIANYFFNGLSAKDRAAFLAAGKEMQKIKGHPVSTRVEWYLTGDACAEKQNTTETRESKSSTPTSLSDLAGSLFAKKAQDEMKEAENKPILSFVTEVKAARVEPAHDSTFTVPKGFKLIGRR